MARSIDDHKPDCSCPVCRHTGDAMVIMALRIPEQLKAWVMQSGGTAMVRRVLEEARQEQAGRTTT